MKVDLLRLFTSADRLGDLDKLSEAKYWKVSTATQSGIPVDSVSWRIKDATDVIGTFKFKDGTARTLQFSQDISHVDKDNIEFDSQPAQFPHVSIRVTTVGVLPMNLAIIVKNSFSANGEAKQYRFDCHIPIASLADLFHNL